jgi:CRP-like cAMP-binding protein
MAAATDRRCSPRVGACLEAHIQLSGMGRVPCATRDVGFGGACLETASPFDPSAVQRIEIRLPGVGPLSLHAEGRWQRVAETGVLTGIRFCEVSSRAHEELKSFTSERALEVSRFLAELPDLGELPIDEALDLALNSRLRVVPPGTLLYRQGASPPDGDSIYIVVTGRIVLEAAVQHEHEIHLDTLGSRRLFGGLPVLAGVPHVESAVAETKCELLEFSRVAFEYLATAKPLVAHRLVQAVLRRQAGQLEDLIRRVSKPPARPSAVAA